MIKKSSSRLQIEVGGLIGKSCLSFSPTKHHSDNLPSEEIYQSLYYLGRALYRYSLLKKKEREK